MKKRRVLIAEDEEPLNKAIAATLDQEGLETILAYDGDEALKLTRELLPDLVLLDVMMPGTSGLEVCARLKMDPTTRSIPVILVTAKAEEGDRLKGLAMGASEYLTKPFSPIELISLVNQALAGQRIEPRLRGPDLSTMPSDQLVVYAQELRELVKRERAERRDLEKARRRLEEVDRLKSAFLSTVTHELLTPFASIGLALEVLQKVSDGFRPEQVAALDNLMREVGDLHRLVNGLVKFAELLHHRREPQRGYYSLHQVIPPAVKPVAELAQSREVDFRIFVPADLPQVHVDPELLSEAVFQMAHNAVKFNHSGGEAQLRAFESELGVKIEVSDTGEGLTPERLELLGQPFEQSADALRRGQEGLGVGWALVCYVAEVHGGQTQVESPGPDQGSTFSLILPAAEPDPGREISDQEL